MCWETGSNPRHSNEGTKLMMQLLFLSFGFKTSTCSATQQCLVNFTSPCEYSTSYQGRSPNLESTHRNPQVCPQLYRSSVTVMYQSRIENARC